MNKEILLIIDHLKDVYEGEPWFGRNAKSLLDDAGKVKTFERLSHEHSLVELLWHIITWREFTIDRLQHSQEMQLGYFENNDWRKLDHKDKTLWPQGLERLQETQDQLIQLLTEKTDEILEHRVRERTYNFRKLLYGMIEHDIYHLGQIAYITKLLKAVP